MESNISVKAGLIISLYAIHKRLSQPSSNATATATATISYLAPLMLPPTIFLQVPSGT